MSKKNNPSETWLSLKDAAVLIGISPQQLTLRALEGEIAHKREGHRGRGRRGMFLFARSDVDAYNARKRIPARFELEVQKSRVPTMRTRMFIDPDDCGESSR